MHKRCGTVEQRVQNFIGACLLVCVYAVADGCQFGVGQGEPWADVFGVDHGEVSYHRRNILHKRCLLGLGARLRAPYALGRAAPFKPSTVDPDPPRPPKFGVAAAIRAGPGGLAL